MTTLTALLAELRADGWLRPEDDPRMRSLLERAQPRAKARAALPAQIGPEPGRWFRACAAAYYKAAQLGLDRRWGRSMRRVRVPQAWTLYRDRAGKVRVGNLVQMVPEPWLFAEGRYPVGVVDLGGAQRA